MGWGKCSPCGSIRSCLPGGDREMIEDLLPAAFNAAHAKAKEMHQQAMQEITSDLNLPGIEEAIAKLTEPPSPS